MEAHSIALELKYQNQALKSRQHGQILKETSNKAKIKKEIDAYETINIELEHSVAKLLTENEHLQQQQPSKTIEQTTSFLANNAHLKAQIQEKVFAIAALKNELRKLKGNIIDTKFAKTSVLGKPVLQSLRNQSVVRQPNAFKSERPQISKPRRESAFAKPDQVIESSESSNSSKNMLRFSSNDMVHNYYLEEDRKKTQERHRNSKSYVMHTAIPQNTTKGHSFSPNKTSAVYEKTSPRSDFRWKHTGRIFKSVGLRWIPTGKLFTSYTSKADSKPTYGSNVDISKIHECKQTLDLSAGTSINVQKEQSFELSAEAPTVNMIELESLFGPLFNEYFNGENQVVSKSSVVTTADASDKRQQQPDSTSSTSNY
ncbi:hypothetical protein Tco_0743581 [Tanacetum coccineum]